MKIAIYNLTNTQIRGGIEMKMWQLSRHLTRLGHDVTLLAGWGPLGDPLHTPGLKIRKFPFIHRKHVFCGGTRFRKAIERWSMTPTALVSLLATSHAYDGVVINKPYDLPMAFTLRRLRGTRICFISGGGEYMPGFGRMARSCEGFMCPSQADSDEVFECYGVRPVVNPLGVDTDIFYPEDWDADLAKRVDVRQDDVVLMTTSRLEPIKGHAVGLQAVALLRNRLGSNQRLRYLVVGEGSLRPSLEKQVKDLGLCEQVSFLGSLPQHEIRALYGLADVALFPSNLEALGIAIGEAMACRVPVVGSALGGIPEQIIEGTGVLVNQIEDPQAFADGVANVLSKTEEREARAERGRQHIVDNFSWEKYALTVEDALREQDSMESEAGARGSTCA